MSSGISYFDLMKHLDDDEKKDIFSLNSKQRIRLKNFITCIRNSEENKDMNSYQKGQLFERLVYEIFDDREIFHVKQNIKTNDFEIDFVIKLTIAGRRLKSDEVIPKWFPDYFLIECKNFKKNIEIGIISKFYGLMESRGAKLGLFISNKGIAGRGKLRWQDAASFVNKVNLSYLRAPEPKVLLDLSLDDLEKLCDDCTNIVDILMDIHCSFFNDIYAEIKHDSHENESQINLS